MALYDFHMHTFLSDGELLPVELVRRCIVSGYTAMAITDHAGPGNAQFITSTLTREAQVVKQHWGIVVVPGVELTHVPASAIDEVARNAKFDGARLVVVHGETPVEPVEPGTNRAAILSSHVDILAHPGFLTEEEARIAAENGTFIEVTARRGHSLTNGHVVQVGRAAGVRFLVNSDTHSPGDILTETHARKVALGAGLREEELETILAGNPKLLLQKLGLG
jgi:histidinol phosphatase-like PHP family hydrolase